MVKSWEFCLWEPCHLISVSCRRGRPLITYHFIAAISLWTFFFSSTIYQSLLQSHFRFALKPLDYTSDIVPFDTPLDSIL